MSLLNAALQFLPLVVFWLVQHFFGLKPAIAVTVAMVVAETGWRLARRLPLSRIYLFTSGMVLVFGGIDLFAKTPFMLKYEAVITTIVTGIIFMVSGFGAKTMIQQMVEQQSGKPLPDTRDIRSFFRIFTFFWAAYFFLKAGIYFWIGQVLPLQRALVYRSVIGTSSLVAMLGVSTQGDRLFRLLHRFHLLPKEQEQAEQR